MLARLFAPLALAVLVLSAPSARSPTTAVLTPLGIATGTADDAATRFAVRYGVAARWLPSIPALLWTLPSGMKHPGGTPHACPQDNLEAGEYAEDCLALLLYVPHDLPKDAPTILWIHGGSFVEGSASDPGLDGAQLAAATRSIVAVAQYRLGGLGFLAPNGQTNLGTKDIATALRFLHEVLPSFGGAPGRITLAGQSAGGTIIRALLAAPSAEPLFQSAILLSDPMDYGFYTPATQATLDKNFRAHLNCTAADVLCLARLPVAHILDAAAAVTDDAPALDAAVALGEELRPVRDGAFVAASLTPSTPFPRQHKPLLLTTVPDEARYTIYAVYDEPVDAASYVADIAGAYGAHEAAALLNMSVYAPPRAGADARVQLEAVGTDAIWRCPTWSLARAWAGAGAHAYVGQFAAGASYPGNDAVPACAAPGAVCHQDDIEIVFGTAPAPGAAQAAATREVQARIRAFVHLGVPNAPGYAAWAPAGTSDVHAIELGKNGTAVPVGACTPTFWGAEVEYDYQVYGL